jgi:hypothetical protein
MARVITEYEIQLEALIRPLRTAKYQVDVTWSRLEAFLAGWGVDYGGLELNPDFQRGHVWTESQQVHFLANCMRGVVASNGHLLQFNCSTFADDEGTDLPAGLQCLDGLQRYTAVTRFVRGEIKVFGLTAAEFANTQFCPKKAYMKVAVHSFTQRAELLTHYIDINSGGTQHSAEEIARVRLLLEDAKAKSVAS